MILIIVTLALTKPIVSLPLLTISMILMKPVTTPLSLMELGLTLLPIVVLTITIPALITAIKIIGLMTEE